MIHNKTEGIIFACTLLVDLILIFAHKGTEYKKDILQLK